jgi:hypothetical protein
MSSSVGHTKKPVNVSGYVKYQCFCVDTIETISRVSLYILHDATGKIYQRDSYLITVVTAGSKHVWSDTAGAD